MTQTHHIRRSRAQEPTLAVVAKLALDAFPGLEDTFRRMVLFVNESRDKDGDFYDHPSNDPLPVAHPGALTTPLVPRDLPFTSSALVAIFDAGCDTSPVADFFPTTLSTAGITPHIYAGGCLYPLVAWRYSGGRYRFDPEMIAALDSVKGDIPLPSEGLQHIPEHGILIELPTSGEHPDCLLVARDFLGGNYHLAVSYYPADQLRFLERQARLVGPQLRHTPWTPELAHSRAELLYASSPTQSFSIPLSKHTTVEEAVHAIVSGPDSLIVDEHHDSRQTTHERVLRLARRAISACAYLVSEEPDIAALDDSPWRPTANTVKQTRKGPRFFVPPVRTWNVGFSIGDAISRSRAAAEAACAQQAGGRKPPRPHLRRAHWHSYWTGPRNDPAQRKRVLKFLPPIYVAPGNDAKPPSSPSP